MSEPTLNMAAKGRSKELFWHTLALGIVFWIFQCSLTLADPDLWGHTLYGIRAVDKGVLVEREDPFSYTANGTAWVNHEWAAEYEMGWLWMQFGNSGLLAWKCFWLGALTIWLVMQTARSDSLLGARMMLFVIITLSLSNFVVFIRPQLVTIFLFPIFLKKLHEAVEKTSKGLWLLPMLMVIWVNHHGGFLAGIALIGFYTGIGWLRYLRNPSAWPIAKIFTLVLFTSIAATFVNPFGWGLHAMLWKHLGSEQFVREWQPLWAVGISWGNLAPFLLLAFSFVFSRRWKWLDLFSLLIISFQALIHLRHISLLCLAELVLLPPILSDAIVRLFPQLCQRWGAPESRYLRWFAFSGVAGFLFMLQLAGGIPLWNQGIKPWEIAVETGSDVPGMPTRAVRFLNDHQLNGNILTSYGWAQFVIWQTFPSSRIGFDGRYRTIYNHEIEQDFVEFQRYSQQNSLSTPFLDEHPTQIVLLPAQTDAVKRMQQRSDWLEVYNDGQATIFLDQDLHALISKSLSNVFVEPDQGRRWEIFPTAHKSGTEIAVEVE